MKIIEAMKTVKSNQAKQADLRARIAKNSARTTLETPEYPDATAKIREWLQSIHDIGAENTGLLVAIQRTNLATNVTITLGGTAVTKSIAEWVWRRREYAQADEIAWQALSDRGIKEGMVTMPGSTDRVEIKIVRNFDPATRDEKLALYRSEPHDIDAALEVVNATTDLVEA
jgi:hypothetical protein